MRINRKVKVIEVENALVTKTYLVVPTWQIKFKKVKLQKKFACKTYFYLKISKVCEHKMFSQKHN
jgi:hypothetical protein